MQTEQRGLFRVCGHSTGRVPREHLSPTHWLWLFSGTESPLCRVVLRENRLPPTFVRSRQKERTQATWRCQFRAHLGVLSLSPRLALPYSSSAKSRAIVDLPCGGLFHPPLPCLEFPPNPTDCPRVRLSKRSREGAGNHCQRGEENISISRSPCSSSCLFFALPQRLNKICQRPKLFV